MDLFKQYLGLEPAEMQVLTSMISFPWCLKLVYGLIADNVPIYGSRRRSYVFINGLLSFLCLLPLVPDLIYDKYIIALILTVFSMTGAFNDVIIDALMVQEARKDPKHGSQDLNSYSYLWMSTGGIVGSLLAAFFTQYMSPHASFFISALLGLLIATYGLKMNKSIEGEAAMIQMKQRSGFFKEVKSNLKQIGGAIRIPQIYRTLIYYLLCGVLVPSFGDVNYFF